MALERWKRDLVPRDLIVVDWPGEERQGMRVLGEWTAGDDPLLPCETYGADPRFVGASMVQWQVGPEWDDLTDGHPEYWKGSIGPGDRVRWRERLTDDETEVVVVGFERWDTTGMPLGIEVVHPSGRSDGSFLPRDVLGLVGKGHKFDRDELRTLGEGDRVVLTVASTYGFDRHLTATVEAVRSDGSRRRFSCQIDGSAHGSASWFEASKIVALISRSDGSALDA